MVRILNRILAHKVIVNCEREPYLHRWYLLRTKRVAIFIHRFIRSDEDRALHDHPWDFLVIPIWRGYIEHNERPCDCWHCTCQNPSGPRPHFNRANQTRVLPFVHTRFRRGTYRHRVELIGGKPSWSIFVRFKEWRTWGFWLPTGFIQWNQWWKEKCE
jgi:hypothetical protein